VSVGELMIFPALFAAGMVLVDTTDGVLMLAYNVTITAVSALAALLIALIEAAAMMAKAFALEGTDWFIATQIAEHFTIVGVAIIGLLAVAWAVSCWRLRSRAAA
jgi:high-affinity nickel-transport protein